MSNRSHGFLQALTNSLDNNFIDTQILAYSRRSSLGIAHTPLSIHVASEVLYRAIPSFQDLFAKPVEQRGMKGEDPDSDLEDDPPDSIDCLHSHTDVTNPTKTHPDVVNDENSPEAGGLCSGYRRIIFVPSTAYITLKAYIFYLYTGHIEFAPLKSLGTQARINYVLESLRTSPHRPEPCSPKSIYRLAHKIGDEDLKAVALKNIYSGLCANNVVEELFSRFTSCFPKIIKYQTQILYRFGDSSVQARLDEHVTHAVQGKAPHALNVLLHLMHEVLDANPAEAYQVEPEDEEDQWNQSSARRLSTLALKKKKKSAKGYR